RLVLDAHLVVPAVPESPVIPVRRGPSAMAGSAELVVHPVKMDQVELGVRLLLEASALMESETPLERHASEGRLRIHSIGKPVEALLHDGPRQIERRFGISHVDDLVAAAARDVAPEALDVVAQCAPLGVGGNDFVDIDAQDGIVALEEQM